MQMMNELKNKLMLGWQRSSPREQRLLLLGFGLGAIMLAYFGVIAPLQQRAAVATDRLAAEQKLLLWVQERADIITQLRKQGAVNAIQEPLNKVIADSTSQMKIKLIRMQPRDEMLQVWVEAIRFDQLLDWLELLNKQYGITVDALDIERSVQPGFVEVKRLQVKRG
jgi:general secretion pathway protein M